MPRYPLLHDSDWLRRRYATATTQQIAHHIGCTKGAVIAALVRHGIPAKDRTPASKFLRDKAWLTEAYQRLSTYQIAAQLGCAQISVFRAIRAFGIALRPKGPRLKPLPHGAYRTRHADRPGGSNRLHRQIMEAHLGRALERWEHVHHVDGNTLNNDIANLMVLTKNAHHKLHGPDFAKRVAHLNYLRHEHVCATCGRTFKGGNRAKRCPGCRR